MLVRFEAELYVLPDTIVATGSAPLTGFPRNSTARERRPAPVEKINLLK